MMIINGGRGVTQIITGHGNTQVAGRDYFEGGSIRIGRNFGTVIGKSDVMEQRSGPLGFRVEVTLPIVSSLRISGAGNVIYHCIQQDELSLDVSGAGTIDVTARSIGSKPMSLVLAVSPLTCCLRPKGACAYLAQATSRQPLLIPL